jgi:membrane fusion protein (multidrug efflux system)
VTQVAVVKPDDTVQIRAVKVGPRYESLWVITHGVEAGERVIAEGLQKVRDGVKVQAKPYLEDAAGKPAAPAAPTPG